VSFPKELRQEHRFAPRPRHDRNIKNRKRLILVATTVYTFDNPSFAPVNLSNLQPIIPINFFLMPTQKSHILSQILMADLLPSARTARARGAPGSLQHPASGELNSLGIGAIVWW
jgi:hypothetical protein